MSFFKNNIALPDFIFQRKSIIALVGAGGKTSAAFWFANQLKDFGLRVLVSTTTKMFYPTVNQYDYIYITNQTDDFILKAAKNISMPAVHYYANSFDYKNNKVIGLDFYQISQIKQSGLFDVLIIEADGANRKALKAPAEHEPRIPEQSDLVIAVIGAEALFVPANANNIHRWEMFSAVTGCIENQIIDFDIIDRLIKHQNGLFKGAPKSASKICLINKIDLINSEQDLISLARKILLNNHDLQSVVLANMQNKIAIKYNLSLPFIDGI